jgi:hypothetical protein
VNKVDAECDREDEKEQGLLLYHSSLCFENLLPSSLCFENLLLLPHGSSS